MASRKSPWLDMVGDDYIEIAFRAAREADPAALLTYNEYGIELDNYESDNKRQQVLLLLRRLKARNVPIDALGIQSHLPAEALNGQTPGYIGLAHFILQVREMGLQVFITEMDVSDAARVFSTARNATATTPWPRPTTTICMWC